MIQQKIIDLSNFKGGVTLYFHFKNIGNAFFILIQDENRKETFYKRTYEKEFLQVNLPVHSPRILVIYYGADMESYLVRKIDIYKIPYQINEKLRLQRPYDLSDITIRPVRNLPEGSEARFLYNEGIIEWDVDRCADMAQPAFNFILKHETHHYFYGRPIPVPEELRRMPQDLQQYYYDISLEDETECDRGALYACINDGYNFSGIIGGLMDTLHANGHYSASRIIDIHNEITKMHKQLDI